MKRRPTPKKRTRKPARKSVAAESPLTPYEANQQARTVQKLTKQAAALGYELRGVTAGA